ncbi:peptidase M20 family protein [Oscillibacter valericigenes Sjm18-20]|nr:peptidase M20 family protein [Oscillibacter valericigenes Sjm18-20]
MNVHELIAEYRTHAIEVRRQLHQRPELSGKEFKTTAFISKELMDYGLEIEKSGLPTGVISILHGKKDGAGKVLALRCDIDALPLAENSKLSFCSQNPGVCHACGHDLHTSALLLCARTLKALENEFSGTVKFLFQPAEEIGSGAQAMLAHGAMTNPTPDLIVAAHTWPDTPAGKIGYFRGGAMASSDAVTITIHGKGGHGAHPYRCIDPVTISAYLVTQLQAMVSRQVPALESVVLSFGVVEAASAPNIIPDQVVLKGTLRTLNPVWRTKAAESIRRISASVCEAMGAQAEVIIQEGMPVLINNDTAINLILAAAETVLGPNGAVELPSASMGSEDFSHYLEYAPGALFRMGTGSSDPSTHQGLHSSNIRFDEDGIPTSAAVMTQLALNFCQ